MKHKKRLIKKLELLREIIELLIERFPLPQLKFYDGASNKDISKHVNVSLYIPEGIIDGI